MVTMQDRVAALESAMLQMQERQEAGERRANRWRGVAAVLALLVVVGLAPQASQAQLTLDQRVAVLETKLQHLTVNGTAMIFTGVNLFVRNGTGTTNTANGLGNLIIGYNELRPLNPDGTNPNV